MMRSGNPALRTDMFRDAAMQDKDTSMTIQGTVNKTFMLLMLTVFSAFWSWGNPYLFQGFMIPAAILGFIVAMITVFKKNTSHITAPIYAVLEGIFLGGISLVFEKAYPGVVIQAVFLTFGTLFSLLAAYKSGLIKVTENFKLGIFAATGAIAIIYLVSMIMGFFGKSIPMIHQSTPLGIGFSLVVVVIAALNLVLDFDFIEKGAEHGAPKYMEWYAAFGLMVTLIWLYLELLRLLAKLQRR